MKEARDQGLFVHCGWFGMNSINAFRLAILAVMPELYRQ